MRRPQPRIRIVKKRIHRHSDAARQCAARLGVRIAKKTKSLGNRMQQDNARPSAAYTLPRQRNAWAIECNKTMRSPQRCTHCQENEIPGQSNATRQCAALSSVHIHLHCVEQQSTAPNLTKYCACHAKCMSRWIHITYETLFTMRGATVNTLQPHQILRLPRKMTAPNPTEIC